MADPRNPVGAAHAGDVRRTGAPSADDAAVFETHLPLPDRRQGKVRDVYRLPAMHGPDAVGERLLIVATDRVSAFDVVMPTPIPGKGRLLTEISTRWFELLRAGAPGGAAQDGAAGRHADAIVEDHLLSTDADGIPGLDESQRGALRGRVMICRRARVVPIECVARGYLAGSGWTAYQRDGAICGVRLPAGLREGDRLPAPIFTPATKAEQGHDENIDFERTAAIIGSGLATRLRELTLAIYARACAHAEPRGIIIADTKFEFGFALDEGGAPTERLLLVDEVLTPDSSRFWPREDWRPGRVQPSFDKQYLREWLLERVRAGAWDKNPPGPELPPSIIRATLERYEEARRRLWDR
ncbi:MAG: phosphoribosylaminoimidazolesuccinocarboxamide synthase [Phycisphaerales bacterium]